MTATITGGPANIYPDLIMEYRADRDARVVYHDVIGKAENDVTLLPDGKRYGNLSLFFQTKGDAWDAYAALALGLPYEITDTGTPEIDMKFSRDGKMTITLTPDRRHWIVDVDYREII